MELTYRIGSFCIFFRFALHTIRVVPPRRAFCILSALHLHGHGCTQATRVSILALTKMYTLFRYFGTFSRALLAIDRIAMRLDLVSYAISEAEPPRDSFVGSSELD